MLASTPNILQMCSFDANKSTKGASKLRRDLINAEIANLRDLLPLPSSTRQRLSQLQLMALVCVYVRKANYFHHVFRKPQLPPECSMPHFGFSKALSGFLMMMTQNGKLLYISDNAAEYLGHSMEDLLIHGDSVYDIIEKQDHQVIQAELLRTPSPLNLVPDTRSFLCRMNVSRNARRQMRFGDQKVVLVQGHFVSFLPLCSRNEPVFLATCTPVAMPETRECVVQGSTNVFTSIHSMDMKFMHVDRNGEFHLNYSKSSLQGVSWYEMVHWEHLREAQSKHRLITQSEQERSCILLLRLQTGCGKWIWTHAVLQVKDGADSSQQPVIVCTNQVLTEREASVMRANSWLYQFYSLHSKMHYGLAYEAHTAATAAAAAASSPRLPTPYYSAMLPFHPPPPPPSATAAAAEAASNYHLNGAQFHYGASPHQGPLHPPSSPYGSAAEVGARWQALKRPASPDPEDEEPCKSGYVLPSRPPHSSGYAYPSSAPLSASGGPLAVPPLTAVAASGYFGTTSGTQILSSVPYPHLGRFRSHKSSQSEDEVTDLEQSLTPTNTEDVSNMISAGYGRGYPSYLVSPGGGLYASSPDSVATATRRMPETLDMVFRRDEPFYEADTKVRYQTLEPLHESDKSWVGSPRYYAAIQPPTDTRDYRLYNCSPGKTSPYPVFEELQSAGQAGSRTGGSSGGAAAPPGWTEPRRREGTSSGFSSDSSSNEAAQGSSSLNGRGQTSGPVERRSRSPS